MVDTHVGQGDEDGQGSGVCLLMYMFATQRYACVKRAPTQTVLKCTVHVYEDAWSEPPSPPVLDAVRGDSDCSKGA